MQIPFVEQAFEHETFFTRLHQFVLMSDAYIVAPGGIGTLLEASMIWQLLQVRHLDVLIDFRGSYVERARRLGKCEQMLRHGFELAGERDLTIPICVDNAAEAIAIIRNHHAKWLAAAAGSPASEGQAAGA